jgi:hypothetical protein
MIQEISSLDLVMVLRYLDLLRVPFLIGLVLILLPCVAVFTGARSLLAGLFDVTPRGFYFASLGAIAVSWTVMVTTRILLTVAYLRIPGLAPLPVLGTWPQWGIGFALLAIPVAAAALWISPRHDYARRWMAGLLAAGTMAALFAGGRWLYLTLEPQLKRASAPVLASALRHAPVLLGGYVDAPEVLRYHLTSVIAFGLALGLYAALGYVNRRRLGGDTVPALTSVLLLLLMLGWAFSGLTFFFDAYRVPLFLVLAVWFAVAAQFRASDHYYRVLPLQGGHPEPPTPAETLLAGGRERVIVVAANGGGIQAAAWTARVLTGLEQDLGPEFSRSVRLVSAVSGGSVGAMYFIDAYGHPDGFNGVLEHAMGSSLDEVAWGLVYPDFWRLVFPPLVKLVTGRTGRGQALEQSWEGRDAGLAEKLSAWREDVRRGERPAVVFNATLAEMGFRLLFSTAPLDPCQGLKGSHTARLNFEELYPDHDLSVSTAVRLSATFPYVSPAARADVPGTQPHVVDGGYYDNFGMSTLVEWLDAALEHAGHQVKHVLIVQIRGARVREATAARAKKVSSRGWFYQAFAPIATMLSVRGAAQVSHNEAEYGLLQRTWQGKVELRSVVLEFPGEHPPTSWHLTDAQKNAIEDAWGTETVLACREQVRQFLAGESSKS